MKFSVKREHRDFFRKHSWIECHEIFSFDEQKKFLQGLLQALQARLNKQKKILLETNDRVLTEFDLCRDLWRESPTVKKFILDRNLAGIAGELIEQKPIRYGYSLFFPKISVQLDSHYHSFLQSKGSLAEVSCIQGVFCGAMICLSLKESSALNSNPSSLFALNPGNIVFFSPDYPLPLQEIQQRRDCSFLLIAYAKPNAVYYRQPLDPHFNELKKLGYNFGDCLKEVFHPILYV